MTTRGLVTIIAASCFVADCLAILVRALSISTGKQMLTVIIRRTAAVTAILPMML